MVEQVNTSYQDGSVHLNGHHHVHNNTKTKAAEDSSVLGPSYRQIFKSRALYPMLVIAAAQAATMLYDKLHVQAFFHDVAMEIPSTVDTYTVCLTLVAAALTYLAYYFVFVPGPVLMLDFATFKPDDCLRVSRQTYVEKAKRSGFFTDKSLDFQEKVLALSGLGDETYAPPSTLLEPVDRSLKASHSEAQACIFGVADEIFAQGIVKPKAIDILVLNCSVYSPVPSLAAMVVNKYKMRKDIQVFNLGGMGCSAGLIAVDLATKLLQGRRNSYALVISTEIISAQFGYPGNQRSMMVPNCLFRTGSAGVLLSNRRGNPTLNLNLWSNV